MKSFAAILLTLTVASSAFADLTPDQVAIVAMKQSEKSRELANYYAESRGIPASQILLLDGPPGVSLSRAVWDEQLRPAIRAWLKQDDRAEKIRCFVTVWDVPLRIERRPASNPTVVDRLDYLGRTRESVIVELNKILASLDTIVPDEVLPAREPLAAGADLAQATATFESALKEAQGRAKGIDSTEEKKHIQAEMEKAVLAAGGTATLLRNIARQASATQLQPQFAQKLGQIAGEFQGIRQGLQSLNRLPDAVARDGQIVGLLQKTNGLLGVLAWIDQQQQLLSKNETYCSFDSELSLVQWADYPLFQWVPNPWHYKLARLTGENTSTLMVARLEAPTFELAKGLVDKALATEKTGLKGKVYLDARGISYNPAADRPGSYGEYDESLRELAELLKNHTKLEVVFDNEAQLFAEGSCPDAALYCGWYSLAKYIDAFTWQPGAVGYHMASSEATTLRTPGGKVWCNAMLEDGITATLGPVHEPYLAAFPKPADFFPLLLTGKYTLVEAYYRTKPFNSWAMVLVGDPLYTPFKANPALAEQSLPERLRDNAPQEPVFPAEETPEL